MFLNIFNDNPGSTFLDIQDASIDSEIATSNLPQTPTINISTFVSCTIGLILSLPFLIAFICSFLGTVGSAEVYRIICTIFEIETLGLLLFSKLKLKSQFYEIFKNELPFNSYQILFLCVTSGAVAFETFEGIAGLMQGGKLICFILFLNKILQVVANVEQTDMILHTKNVSLKPRNVQIKFFKVSRIFLCIFVINMSRWVIDSLFMGHAEYLTVIQRRFYGDLYWKTIVHAIFPVHVFYRFLSAIEMYELYQITC